MIRTHPLLRSVVLPRFSCVHSGSARRSTTPAALVSGCVPSASVASNPAAVVRTCRATDALVLCNALYGRHGRWGQGGAVLVHTLILQFSAIAEAEDNGEEQDVLVAALLAPCLSPPSTRAPAAFLVRCRDVQRHLPSPGGAVCPGSWSGRRPPPHATQRRVRLVPH